ncbi:MAG: DUF350 domain-containing protein [Gammaproteobacteria bacterium]
MGALDNLNLAEIISTVVYALIGVGLLGISWIIIEWITPFSLRREIEEDQNLAIAVLIGALFLAIAIIIAAVIRS